jgi:hypothetical protein
MVPLPVVLPDTQHPQPLQPIVDTLWNLGELSIDSDYFCNLCKTRVRIQQIASLLGLPGIITLMLKVSPEADRRGRLSEFDSFSLMGASGEKARYILVSMAERPTGDAHGGHWTTRCHDSQGGMGYKISDEIVIRSGIPSITAHGVFLVYRKESILLPIPSLLTVVSRLSKPQPQG